MTLTLEPQTLQTAQARKPKRRRRRLALLIAGVLAALLVSLLSVLAYKYLNHPGRLTTSPEYTGLSQRVSANTLSSVSNPSLDLTFDERFTHLGGQKFVLYGTADTEQHFFVEEHPDGSLKSMFWIQYEGFLADNDFTYDYSGSPLRLQLGDVDFFTDTAPGTSAPIRLEWPGTDGALARSFLADRGYSWPDDYAYARLVHVPDEAARHELLIIYVDDLTPTGLTGSALRDGGDDNHRWPEVEAAHLDKIKDVMTVSRP